MARHHVISTTACDVFFKLVAHQKKSLGARFDSMIVTFSADGRPVLGATLRNTTSGCELHRLAGQPDECWCCGYDEQLEFISQNKVPLAHADYRLTLSNGETWTGTTDAKGRTGRVVAIRGLVRLGLDYKYVLLPKKKLSDYNMEAQGDLLADYHTLKYLKDPDAMRQPKYQHSLQLYEEVLHDFFKDRKSKANLPGRNAEHEPLFDIP